ncbi:hypothetical protein BJ165DRAFT_1558400 [Panaeolus papilionaceus]|nr:hypothetical protein BJ165DRAFT_1558400 [Panaeolus papilionaceus]
MDTSLEPITQAAKRRAQAADPNGRHCLVENCTSNRAVQLAHVFQRDAATNEMQTGSLEWTWNMQRQTLNLDTRRNIFFLGASMNQLYRENKWALLPEQAIVNQYYDEDGLFVLTRGDFPEIQIWKNSSSHAKLTFQMITSHIHPTFAIVRLGFIIERKLQLDERRALKAKYPILDPITSLYKEWTLSPPDNARDDPTFIPPRPPHNECAGQIISESSSQVDSNCTPRRRIPLTHTPIDKPSTSSGSSYSSGVAPVLIPKATHPRRVQPLRKKKLNKRTSPKQEPLRRKSLTSRALQVEENQGTDTNKWTPQKISKWAEVCNPSFLPKTPVNKLGRPRRKKR